MITGVGVDLVELSRMAAAYSRHAERLVARICTRQEADWVRCEENPSVKLASAFAIKEAVMKALGTGMRGVGWREIETRRGAEGRVETLLEGRALHVARARGLTRYCFSVTVSAELVLAAVLLSAEEASAV